MAFELIGAVNALHSAGYDLDGNTGIDFFTGTDCATIAVNGAMYDPSNPLLSNPRMVAAAASLFDAGPPAIPNTGDGANALALADLAYAKIAGLNNQSFGDNLTTLSVSLGAAALSERERAGDGEAVLNMLKNSMQSETGVSMDEELVDQSAARLVTTIDEMMETVINRMA
jgi:flagellar hook-associated protein 1 FlgK